MENKIDKQKLIKFGNLELLAKQVVEGFITGMHKSPFHGFSVEFAEHRSYNSGESTRHVDWKLFARTDKLFTKKYEEETNLRCQIVLDTSSSMYFENSEKTLSKMDFAVYAIASLIELLKKQRDAVGLSLFDEKLNLHTPAKSSVAHHRYLYAELEKLISKYKAQEKKKTSTNAALHDIAELTHKRSLILIFSDMLDNPENAESLFNALQHLKYNKHEVIIFHLLDHKTEMNFELENRPYTLLDMETGEKIKLMPNAIKDKYTKEVKAYFKKIKDKSLAYKIDFVPIDINENLNDIFVKYLNKRKMMR